MRDNTQPIYVSMDEEEPTGFLSIPVHEAPDPIADAIIGLEQHAHMVQTALDRVYLNPSEEMFISRSVIRAITDYCDQLLAIYQDTKRRLNG